MRFEVLLPATGGTCSVLNNIRKLSRKRFRIVFCRSLSVFAQNLDCGKNFMNAG